MLVINFNLINLSEVDEIAIYQKENKLYLFICVYFTRRGVFAQFEVFLLERELLTWSIGDQPSIPFNRGMGLNIYLRPIPRLNGIDG